MAILEKKRVPSKTEKKPGKKITKIIKAKRHLGKVKWGEDALAYQNRKRHEWK